MTADLLPWGGGLVLRPLAGGARSRLFLAEGPFGRAVARATAEGEASLRWLSRVQALARRAGIEVADMIPTGAGALSAGGWVLERFLEGRPGLSSDLRPLRAPVDRLHRMTSGFPDRPGRPPAEAGRGLPHGLRRVCRAALPGGPMAAVHGDLHPGNILRLPGGGLALIDWEEARRDRVAIDRLALCGGLAGPAHLAAEVVACWRAEPERARRLARKLRLTLALSGRGVWP